MKIVEGGVTFPEGFRACGRHVGLRKVKKDMSLLVSEVEAEFAGSFTQSVVRAAPIERNERLKKNGGKVRGVVCISGNANACTGQQGTLDNDEMAETLANCIGVKPDEILTASTGVIGVWLNMDVVNNGIKNSVPFLSADKEDAHEAATGITTTDTFIKEIALLIEIGGKTVKIGGMSKGSGMIHPNMATVLTFVTTDININKRLLQKALNECVNETYNMISVDGATSTNDMAIVMANGLAGNADFDEESEDYQTFKEALMFVNEKFAKDIIHDGEGAMKFMEVSVFGANSKADARALAKSVVTNNLVKTAMFGEDANWGRVLAAMGGAGCDFNIDNVRIVFRSSKGSIVLMEKGIPIKFDENKAAEILRKRDIYIDIHLAKDGFMATAWGCDLSHEYVRINGEYRART